MNSILAFVAVMTMGLLFACSAGSNPLDDTEWELESYGMPENLTPVLKASTITALFDSEENRLSGSAGCNNYFGNYEVKGNKLSLPGPIASTLQACEEPAKMEQEQQYLTALRTIETYEMDAGKLRIFYSGGGILNFMPK